MTNKNKPEISKEIEKALQHVYDPEFSLIDIYNLGLIYHYSINKKEKKIYILMTLTSPMCPFGEHIIEMVKNAVEQSVSEFSVEVELTFDPMWSPELIKDEDIKKMFQ